MKKTLLKMGFFLCLGLAFNQSAFGLTGEDVNKILQDLIQLTNKLADPQTGLPTRLDRLSKDITKIKLFNNCVKLRKQKKDYNFVLAAQDVKVSCGSYKDVMEAAKNVLEFIRNDAVGTKESFGVLYLILDILRSAGIKDVEKIQNTVNDINTIISNINEILDGLKLATVKETDKIAVHVK